MSVEAKVGFFVVLGISMLFLLTTQVSEFKNMSKDGYRIQVFVDDSTGLEANSKVKMNGINIGWLESFSFSDDFIILNIFIEQDYKIPIDSEVQLVKESLLGSRIIAITRGSSNENLVNNAFLKKYKKYASFENTSDSFYQTSEEFRKLAEDIRESLNKQTRDELGEAILNLSVILKDIKEMVKENRQGVNNSVGNMEMTTARFPEILESLERTLEKYRNVGTTLDDKLPEVLSSIQILVEELNGTIAENKIPLNKSIKSFNSFFTKGEQSIKKLDKIIMSLTESEVQLSMRFEGNVIDKTFSSYANISYLPNPNTYYLFSRISAPDFSKSADGQDLHEKGIDLFSVQYGKRYKNWLLRAGLIESRGGFGLDYFAKKDKLKLSLDVFDFNSINDIRNKYANIKFSARYRIYNHIDLFVGGTNLINEDIGMFFGLGFYFIDNDLKLFAGSI
jgi:phospholipid/cholesterol/gamma-HCH transport system substrate-binding protein